MTRFPSETDEILAMEKEHIVAVRYRNQLAMSFHPELDEDDHVHRYFIDMIESQKNCFGA